MGQKLTCEKCGRTMDELKFYTYKNGKKTEMCKDCLTMHIDNYDPNTFLWLLEKMDVPYVPSEWNVLGSTITIGLFLPTKASIIA